MKKYIILLLVFSLILSFSGCTKEESVVPAVAQPEPIDETITLVTVGDNLLHMPVIRSGLKSDGSYEFSHIFQKLQPVFEYADIAVIGQETVFAGEKYGYSGYPLFNSPSDMGKTLVDEGFDIILHASNHVLDKWADGVENTLKFWDNYPDITVLGINKNEEAKNEVNIIERKGTKIAVLNYTYGTNGLKAPADKKYLVNYIDEDKIKSDADFSEINADFTVAFMHWGTEYATKPDAFQKDLCQKMCNWGVDLIIGSHPHVIQPVEWYESEDNSNKMLVYYSLGNFVSRQLEARNLLGALADVTLKYDGKNVYIDEYKFVPIVTHYNTSFTDFDVYRLSDYNNNLAKLHGINGYDGAVSVERWKNMVKDVFNGYDLTCVQGL